RGFGRGGTAAKAPTSKWIRPSERPPPYATAMSAVDCSDMPCRLHRQPIREYVASRVAPPTHADRACACCRGGALRACAVHGSSEARRHCPALSACEAPSNPSLRLIVQTVRRLVSLRLGLALEQVQGCLHFTASSPATPGASWLRWRVAAALEPVTGLVV